jgi:hypothetical protein
LIVQEIQVVAIRSHPYRRNLKYFPNRLRRGGANVFDKVVNINVDPAAFSRALERAGAKNKGSTAKAFNLSKAAMFKE